jgi:hypothetical protein
VFITLLAENKKKARCAKATIFFKDYILHMVFMCWPIMHFSYNCSNARLIFKANMIHNITSRLTL